MTGAATQLAVAPDASLYALSTQPAGANKYIFRNAGGTWTLVHGLTATSIAVGPDGTLYASNSILGMVYARAGSSWKPLGGAGLGGLAASGDGGLYALGAPVDAAGNRAIWKYAAGHWIRQPGTGARLVGTADPNAYWLPGTGLLAPNGYFVIKADGGIYYYNSAGTSYLHFHGSASGLAPVPGGFVQQGYPLLHGGSKLYFYSYATGSSSLENGLAIDLASGPEGASRSTQLYAVDDIDQIFTTPITTPAPLVTFKQFPFGAPSDDPLFGDITVAPNGSLWFGYENCVVSDGCDNSSNYVTSMTPSGTFSSATYALTINASSANLTFAPGGTLWAASQCDYCTDSLYQFPPAGGSTWYSLPSGGVAMDLTFGPDGNVWFVEVNPAKVGRITSAGTIDEYSVPTPPGTYGSITSGSDGALWFTARGAIGRVTTSGAVTTYPLSDGNVDTIGITTGPDGALWFTEGSPYSNAPAKIGRITTAGKITEYPLASPASYPFGIVTGPDGAIWFTERGAGKIGRITTSGKITEYPVPAASSEPAGIAADAAGRLWFVATGNNANEIVRVVLQF